MARRRSEDGLNNVDDDPLGGGFDGGVDAPLRGGPIGVGDFTLPPTGGSPGNPRPGPIDPDMDNALRGIFARDGGDIAGNTDKARDLNPQTPNTLAQPANTFGLPQGVSVNESMFSEDAPAMPQSPAPAAGRPANPSFAQPESRAPGPVRRSASPSALCGEQGSSQMFGRAGGLLGGGIGVPGAGSDGEVDPTAMFKKLLEQFGQA